MSKRSRKIAKISYILRELGRESQMETIDLELEIEELPLLSTRLLDFILAENRIITVNEDNKSFTVRM